MDQYSTRWTLDDRRPLMDTPPIVHSLAVGKLILIWGQKTCPTMGLLWSHLYLSPWSGPLSPPDPFIRGILWRGITQFSFYIHCANNTSLSIACAFTLSLCCPVNVCIPSWRNFHSQRITYARILYAFCCLGVPHSDRASSK